MQSKSKNGLNAKAILSGLLSSVALSLTLLLALSIMLSAGKISESGLGAAFMLIYAVAGLRCGIAVRRAGRGRGSLNAIISALVYSVLLCLPSLFSENGSFSYSEGLKIIAITMPASFIACRVNLFKSNKKLRKKSKKR